MATAIASSTTQPNPRPRKIFSMARSASGSQTQAARDGVNHTARELKNPPNMKVTAATEAAAGPRGIARAKKNRNAPAAIR